MNIKQRKIQIEPKTKLNYNIYDIRKYGLSCFPLTWLTVQSKVCYKKHFALQVINYHWCMHFIERGLCHGRCSSVSQIKAVCSFPLSILYVLFVLSIVLCVMLLFPFLLSAWAAGAISYELFGEKNPFGAGGLDSSTYQDRQLPPLSQ